MKLSRPHNESLFNKLEFLNEYCMIALGFVMLNFSNLLPIANPETKEPYPINIDFNTKVEIVAIGIIVFMTGSNFLVMILMSFIKFK